eukprot:CAMPEP_0119315370 /NCGR_PEP_ID=MMETSP1333-20130426/35542_1 /TAXON_ID=418940 /ORGANISM="Scyphosphaera apsteinii, Strain RCC1455" /LENGTH=244 /DNA_ID=CAMNT_0007320711 /DNA_START=46 /DNA_END=780 /DNA_ORIENTATION=+
MARASTSTLLRTTGATIIENGKAVAGASLKDRHFIKQFGIENWGKPVLVTKFSHDAEDPFYAQVINQLGGKPNSMATNKMLTLRISKWALHLHSPDYENVLVIPRAEIARVTVLDTDSTQRKLHHKSRRLHLVAANMIFAALLCVSLVLVWALLWHNIVAACLLSLMAILGVTGSYMISKFMIGRKLIRVQSAYLELVKKGSHITIEERSGNETSFFIEDDKAIDQEFNLFLTNPQNTGAKACV